MIRIVRNITSCYLVGLIPPDGVDSLVPVAGARRQWLRIPMPVHERKRHMLQRLDRIFSYEMKVSEFLGTLIILAVPYGLIGIIWTVTHTEHLREMHGLDVVISFLGSIVCWPVLTFSNVCMT